MGLLGRLVRFLGITAGLSLALFALIAPVLGIAEAKKLTLLMVLPIMWWTRIFLAIYTGRITRRFVFVNNANLSTVLSLTNPDLLERKDGAWDFYGYVAREVFMCAVVWLVMGGGMIYPRMAQALGLPLST